MKSGRSQALSGTGGTEDASSTGVWSRELERSGGSGCRSGLDRPCEFGLTDAAGLGRRLTVSPPDNAAVPPCSRHSAPAHARERQRAERCDRRTSSPWSYCRARRSACDMRDAGSASARGRLPDRESGGGGQALVGGDNPDVRPAPSRGRGPWCRSPPARLCCAAVPDGRRLQGQPGRPAGILNAGGRKAVGGVVEGVGGRAVGRSADARHEVADDASAGRAPAVLDRGRGHPWRAGTIHGPAGVAIALFLCCFYLAVQNIRRPKARASRWGRHHKVAHRPALPRGVQSQSHAQFRQAPL
jgi:hypothetical protein